MDTPNWKLLVFVCWTTGKLYKTTWYADDNRTVESYRPSDDYVGPLD